MAVLTVEDKKLFYECVERLNREINFDHLKQYKHHFKTTTYHHSIGVAYFSFYISRLMGIKCDDETLIYGALLHDYFLYDCHNGERSLHLFKHPNISVQNAKRDWKINKIQENIIRRHMFPITLIPPKYKESIIVSLVDKGCTIYEILCRKPYQKNILKLC